MREVHDEVIEAVVIKRSGERERLPAGGGYRLTGGLIHRCPRGAFPCRRGVGRSCRVLHAYRPVIQRLTRKLRDVQRQRDYRRRTRHKLRCEVYYLCPGVVIVGVQRVAPGRVTRTDGDCRRSRERVALAPVVGERAVAGCIRRLNDEEVLSLPRQPVNADRVRRRQRRLTLNYRIGASAGCSDLHDSDGRLIGGEPDHHANLFGQAGNGADHRTSAVQRCRTRLRDVRAARTVIGIKVGHGQRPLMRSLQGSILGPRFSRCCGKRTLRIAEDARRGRDFGKNDSLQVTGGTLRGHSGGAHPCKAGISQLYHNMVSARVDIPVQRQTSIGRMEPGTPAQCHQD